MSSKGNGVSFMTNIAFVMPDLELVKVVHEAWTLHEQIFGKSRDLRYTVDFSRKQSFRGTTTPM